MAFAGHREHAMMRVASALSLSSRGIDAGEAAVSSFADAIQTSQPIARP
jgi:hypothetical protein